MVHLGAARLLTVGGMVAAIACGCTQVSGLNGLTFGPGDGGGGNLTTGPGGGSGGTGGSEGPQGGGGTREPSGECGVSLEARHAWSTAFRSAGEVRVTHIVPLSEGRSLLVVRQEGAISLPTGDVPARSNAHLLVLLDAQGHIDRVTQLSTQRDDDKDSDDGGVFTITAAGANSSNRIFIAGKLAGDLALDGGEGADSGSASANSYLLEVKAGGGFGVLGYFTDTTQLDIHDLAVRGDQIWAVGSTTNVNGMTVGRINTYRVQDSINYEAHADLAVARSTVARVELFDDGDLLVSGPTDSRFALVDDPNAVDVERANATTSVFVARVRPPESSLATAVQWARVLGSNDRLAATADVAADESDGVVVAGHFSGVAFLGDETQVLAMPDPDLFAVRLQANSGNTIDQLLFPSTGGETLSDFVVEDDVYAVGAFDGDLDFGMTVLNQPNTTPFIAQLGIEGDLCLALDLPGAALTESRLALSPADRVLLGGGFQGTFSAGGPALTSLNFEANGFVAAFAR